MENIQQSKTIAFPVCKQSSFNTFEIIYKLFTYKLYMYIHLTNKWLGDVLVV